MFGGSDVSASIDLVKGDISYDGTKGSIDKNLTWGDWGASAQGGKVSFDNAMQLGATVNLGPVELSGSFNLGQAFVGFGKLAEAAGYYIAEKMERFMKKDQSKVTPGQPEIIRYFKD